MAKATAAKAKAEPKAEPQALEVPVSGRPVPPEVAPPAPSEVADEPVKVGRKKLSAHEADRAKRFERRQKLHEAYGTGQR